MSLFSKISGANSAREQASRLGLSVEKVEREIPVFDGPLRLSRLERGSAIKYSIRRQPHGSPTAWSFLQRSKAQGAQYPNGWLFSSPEGLAPEPLDRLLHRIAEEWSEEYLEFEAGLHEVSLFWEEWGGPKVVIRLHALLVALSAI